MRNFLLSLGILATFGLLCPSSFGGSETRYRTGTGSAGRVPTFTLDQAILTALQQNPTLLNAEQEIKRTKGVIIQVRAQALPQITPSGEYQWTDPKLGTSGGGIAGGASAAQNLRSDIFYDIRVLGTQLVFNGTTFPQIRGTFFQRDSAYFAFRNVLDSLIATVKRSSTR